MPLSGLVLMSSKRCIRSKGLWMFVHAVYKCASVGLVLTLSKGFVGMVCLFVSLQWVFERLFLFSMPCVGLLLTSSEGFVLQKLVRLCVL